MALRSVALCLKISSRKSFSKVGITNISNYKNNGEIFQNVNKLILMNNSFQPNRLYHVSEKQYIKVSKFLFFSSPTEKSDLNSNKLLSDMPIIELDKINQALSDSKINVPKLKDLNIELKDVKSINESVKQQNNDKSVKKLTLVQKIKHEIMHYYHGFRLFFLETRITFGILSSVLRGRTLTRRERKQLVRTVADLGRLAPFMVFIVVPFMEFLLPFYIKFFPFMMPSTFQESSKEVEKTRKLLKVKLEMAKFLQDTLEETRNINKYSSEASINLESFNQFMKKVRETGQTANTDDIVKFSRLFEDEVTLESLEHGQLKALCKLLEMNSIGPKAFLSFHLRMKVHLLKVDDRMIAKEGIDKLPAFELQQLCRERGMRAIGVSEERLRYQLSQWLKLSIEKQVPISLLLLSRTMYLPEHLSPEQQLTKAIFNLPETVSKEASLRSASAGEKFDNKTKWELIKEEHKVILEEKQAAKEAERIEKETLVDTAPHINISEDATTAIPRPTAEESISTSDLNQIETAIESIANAKTALQEEELDELKEQAAELHEQVDFAKGSRSSTTDIFGKKLQNMIDDMDSLLERLRVEKETIIQSIGVGATPEKAEERMIAISDVMKALKQLKSVSGDETKWQRILDVLDEDHDGQIEVHHVTEVLDLLGSDEVKLTSKEMGRLLDAIDKEEAIEKDEVKAKESVKTKL